MKNERLQYIIGLLGIGGVLGYLLCMACPPGKYPIGLFTWMILILILLHIFGKINLRKSGCLNGKTPEMIHDYFTDLYKFFTEKNIFFLEQYDDLQPREKKLFEAWFVSGFEKREEILKEYSLKHGKY